MDKKLVHIDPCAKIHSSVVVEPFTTIYGDVKIGEGTWIGPNVTIMDGARIGKNCKIFPGAVISAIPQDLKFSGEPSLAIVGDNTIIRECVTINRGTSDMGRTTIGNSCLIMAYTHVAHDTVIGDNVIIANGTALGGHIKIGDYAVIGGLVAVHQFVRIGCHSMISGASGVRKDVPPYITAGKTPLSFSGINSVGLKRRGFTKDKIREIQNIYKIIYLQKYNTTQALEYVKLNVKETHERNEILEFIKNSDRGIIKA
ncbi:acyl-ACP--UDP-N-acetylglucosamine O-acyltransferase [Ichthyobacterium seriolicida]|uniref:UDP-N-acetylglucosamine acyltransferase n=1 Tax=Ichthyobacterium seriolicida TaxID=242600 RepID=A0A1J1E1W7_9FLAO|nr:acyl-ACP--UDP-N-acetylglucosamine O-acyltransferase [Ichthyobacterium seriolicida]BAV94949.1 UDP-N-acetylglucosamine acyltransferase [Ichthyobacterium seriolicida]